MASGSACAPRVIGRKPCEGPSYYVSGGPAPSSGLLAAELLPRIRAPAAQSISFCACTCLNRLASLLVWPSGAGLLGPGRAIFGGLVRSGLAQWLACWAHNPKVRGSKPRSAIPRLEHTCGRSRILSARFPKPARQCHIRPSGEACRPPSLTTIATVGRRASWQRLPCGSR